MCTQIVCDRMCCPTLGRPHTIHVQSPIHYHDYRLIDRGMGPVGMKHWMNCATPGMSSAASGRPPRPQTPRRAHSHPQPQSALPENKQIIIKSSSSTHPSFNSYMDAFTFQQRLTFHMCRNQYVCVTPPIKNVTMFNYCTCTHFL